MEGELTERFIYLLTYLLSMETKIENAEDSFAGAAKSSVKLIKNSKGINWEIKVVVGETHLLEELQREAVKCHEALLEKIGEKRK